LQQGADPKVRNKWNNTAEQEATNKTVIAIFESQHKKFNNHFIMAIMLISTGLSFFCHLML